MEEAEKKKVRAEEAGKEEVEEGKTAATTPVCSSWWPWGLIPPSPPMHSSSAEETWTM